MVPMGSKRNTIQVVPPEGCQADHKRQAGLPVFRVAQCILLWRQRDKMETFIRIGYFVYTELLVGGAVYVYFAMLFEEDPETV